MGSLAWLIAHGGTAGLIVEALVALAVAGLFLAVWLRERRHRGDRPEAELRDEDD